VKNELQILLEIFQAEAEQELSDLQIFKKLSADPVNFTRESLAHFTASAFVVNQTHDEALAIYHIGLKLLSTGPISIEVLTVAGHVHRTRGYVSAHLHLNVTFLFEVDEAEPLHKNEEETGGVAWIPLDQFVEKSTEPEMKVVYRKIISRIK